MPKIQIILENNEGTRKGGGGYCDKTSNTIYLHPALSMRKKRLVVLHEVLELYLAGRVKHSKLDTISIAIIELLGQLGLTPD